MQKPNYFTICSRNYLAYAITLGESLRAADPDAKFTIFLADAGLDQTGPELSFDVVPMADVGVPALGDMLMRYNILELNTAIKPSCIKYLFDQRGADAAVYLDPDIYVLRPLQHVEEALAKSADLVLTPHTMSPLDDGADPDDRRILRTGVYNLGFVGLKNAPSSRALVDWWERRLSNQCVIALDDGIFVDQKWMDMGPAFVEKAEILHHKGYNAAYWNLGDRAVEKVGDGLWSAGGDPLHFFHFSGVIPGNPAVFSKHQNRFGVDDIGPLCELLNDYLSQLDRHLHSEWARVPYAYALSGTFSVLEDAARSVYRQANPKADAGIVFDPERLVEMCKAEAGDAYPGLTKLAVQFWKQREDLKAAFDLNTEAGRAAYAAWLRIDVPQNSTLSREKVDELCLSWPAQGPVPLRTRAMRRLLGLKRFAAPIINRMPPRTLSFVKRTVRLLAGDERLRTTSQKSHAKVDLTKDVLVYGYFKAETGLGQAVRNEYRAMRSVGMPLQARSAPTDGQFKLDIDFEFPLEDQPSEAAVHLVHVNADQMLSGKALLENEALSPDRYRIGFWAWEVETFPADWLRALDSVDEVWVPTPFVARAIAPHTSKPVNVFAHPISPPPEIDASIESARARFGLPEGLTLFLSIFDFNSQISRKNPTGLLEAFEKAVQQNPKLGLVLKCHGGVAHDEARRKIRDQARKVPNVFTLDQVLAADEIPLLYRACDVVVSLHRSEGFGITIAEAMSHKLPVIATGYSGICEALSATEAELIPYTMIEIGRDEYPLSEGASWADPDLDAASAAMVRLGADPERRRQLGQAGWAHIMKTYSPAKVGRAMVQRLEDVLDTI